MQIINKTESNERITWVWLSTFDFKLIKIQPNLLIQLFELEANRELIDIKDTLLAENQ